MLTSPKFKLVGCSGTFADLHQGHQTLIRIAFEQSERVMIGLTSDEMLVSKKLKHLIPSFEIRKENMINYLKSQGYDERFEIVMLTDAFGPAIEDAGLEAIVVSKETSHMEEKINAIRKKRNLFPLKFIEVDMVLAEDGKPISSTRVRKKEIDVRGRLLHK
ncbi:MAG: phosphopantetheine adenylyltransferase [Candidatus Helarchaeota archaeon]